MGSGLMRYVEGETVFVIHCICDIRQAEGEELAALQEISSLVPDRNVGFDDLKAWPNANDPNWRDFKAVIAAVKAWASAPEGWIVLSGGLGCGKSTLLYATYNALQGRAVIVYAARLAASFRSAVKADRVDEVVGTYSQTPALMIDDFGVEQLTDFVLEKFDMIFEHRYMHRLPTLVTTNLTIHGLLQHYPRIASRMGDARLSRFFAIRVTDFRLRKDGPGTR